MSDTRNNHRYYDTATHKVVPKDAVVLDLKDFNAPATVQQLRKEGWIWLPNAIEAQTKPLRIPEPGWGVIVEAGVKQHGKRLRWVGTTRWTSGLRVWSCENHGEYERTWDDLVDPQVVQP